MGPVDKELAIAATTACTNDVQRTFDASVNYTHSDR